MLSTGIILKKKSTNHLQLHKPQLESVCCLNLCSNSSEGFTSKCLVSNKTKRLPPPDICSHAKGTILHVHVSAGLIWNSRFDIFDVNISILGVSITQCSISASRYFLYQCFYIAGFTSNLGGNCHLKLTK